jgi:hypothetical protein
VTDAAPEELAIVWSDKIAAAFKALEPRQQKFLLAYLKCYVGSEAYRQSYNELASDKVASVCASRLLAHVSIKPILEAFVDHRTEDLFLVHKVYTDAATQAVKPIYGKDEDGQPIKIEDMPDHDIRIKAASALAKLGGLNAAEKKEVSGNLTVSINQLDELV